MFHKLAGLDLMRALAITLVFFFHYRLFSHPGWMNGNTLIGFGWTGVDLFFVLSGYLIAGQLFARVASGKSIDLRSFFYKRFFRIIPPYIVVVALYFLFPYLRERSVPTDLWRFLTFTQNLGYDTSQTGTFSHAWSLCIEEQFYLVLPLIMLLFVRLKTSYKTAFAWIAGLFLSMTLTRWLSWHFTVAPVLGTDNEWLPWYKWIYYPTFTRLDGLLTGVGLAGLYQYNTRFKSWLDKNGNLMLAMGFALLTIAFFCCLHDMDVKKTFIGFPLVALAYGMIVGGAISPSCLLYKTRSRIMTGIATLSYAVYLTHKITIHVVQLELSKLGIEKEGMVMMMICTVTVLFVAQLMRWLVEKPAMRWRDKVLQRKVKKPSEAPLLVSE